ELHKQLIEYIAESDDSLLEKFFDQGSLTEDELRAGVHAAVQKQSFIPLFCTAAETNVGVSRLMDFIAKYGSSPVDREKVKAVAANGNETLLALSRPAWPRCTKRTPPSCITSTPNCTRPSCPLKAICTSPCSPTASSAATKSKSNSFRHGFPSVRRSKGGRNQSTATKNRPAGPASSPRSGCALNPNRATPASSS